MLRGVIIKTDDRRTRPIGSAPVCPEFESPPLVPITEVDGVFGRGEAPEHLSESHDLRSEIRIAADPVRRVFACQDPDIVIRL
jgi:hypothetical protein